MPTEYTLQELAKLADVTPRTVRYYIAQGLLPSPTQAGPAARYVEGHLERLRLIKKLQAAHLPLAEIRARLRTMGDAQIATMSEPGPVEPPTGNAMDYIRQVLGGPPVAMHVLAPPAVAGAPPAAAPAGRPLPSGPPPEPPLQPPTEPPLVPVASQSEPDRAHWERISLSPDIELHIRRPLTRQNNKRVERLISIARQLIEED